MITSLQNLNLNSFNTFFNSLIWTTSSTFLSRRAKSHTNKINFVVKFKKKKLKRFKRKKLDFKSRLYIQSNQHRFQFSPKNYRVNKSSQNHSEPNTSQTQSRNIWFLQSACFNICKRLAFKKFSTFGKNGVKSIQEAKAIAYTHGIYIILYTHTHS